MAGTISLYGYVYMPDNPSDAIEPRLVSGAETPIPKNERKDSRNIADGICKQAVTTS